MYSWPTHSLARASYAVYAHQIIMSLQQSPYCLTVEKLKIFMFDQGQFRSLFVCLENCYGVARINLLNIILLLPDSPPVFKGLHVDKAAWIGNESEILLYCRQI